jgi:Carboxypeptidase regulatory-like domain
MGYIVTHESNPSRRFYVKMIRTNCGLGLNRLSRSRRNRLQNERVHGIPWAKFFLVAAVVLSFPGFAPAQAPAQEAGYGTVTGHVHGPGGVAVPGATIVLVNPQTGIRKQTWSDENGNYALANVPAGTYRLQTSLVGFRDDVRQPVPVTDGRTLKVNVALMMAYGKEPELPPADSSSPEGRTPASPQSPPADMQQRLQSMAGTTPGGGENGDGIANVRFSGQGGTGQASETGGEDVGTADLQASAANSFLLSGSVGQAPMPGEGDMRQRFRRMREQNSAPGFGGGQAGGRGGGFGGGGGGFFMIGGPWRGRRPQVNRIRGNISETYSNSAFDARPYPLNRAPTAQIPAYTEQFGIGLGGPLTIPGIYHGKDKTSFFFNYSLRRGKNPFDSMATVPSPENLKGDFSSICRSGFDASGVCLDRDASGNVIHQIYDPASNASGPRTPFANNLITSPLDGAAKGLLAYIPAPNLPGAVQNFHLQESLPNSNDRVMGRIGHQLSDKDSLNVFYFLNSSRSQGVSSFPLLTRTTSTLSQNVNIGETHSLGPRLMNNLMVNFNRQRTSTLNPFAYQQNVASTLGINEISTDPRDWGLPIISFTNFTGLNDTVPSLVRNQTIRAMDFLLINSGKHNLRLGGEVRRVEMNNLQDPDPRGTFTFSGFSTSDLTCDPATGCSPASGTGYDFADFLLGLPQFTTVRFGSSSNYFRSWVFSGFAQDDWRVSSKFTANIGLRYEFFQPLTERYGHLSDLELSPGFASASVVTAQSPGTLPASLIRSDQNNFGPRVGIAYRPWATRRLVLRAGYGIFYDESIYQRLTPNLANQPPFAQASTLTTSAQQVLTLENGFPAINPTIASNTYAVDPNFRTPYGQTWNFSVEDEIAREWILSLGYVGTKGTKLDLLIGPNLASAGGLTVTNAQQFIYETSGASSIYNGLRTELIRQFHNGFSLDAEYVFSKSIDDAASVGGSGRVVAQNWQDLQAERGLSSFDVRHRFTLRQSYELPFGDRKRFLNHGGAAAAVLGDWRIMANATIQSGQPLTARVLGNVSASGGTGAYQSLRADATGQPVSLTSSERSALEYFNTAAFAVPPAGQLGNAGRNTIPGPSSANVDMSLNRFVTISRERGIRANFRVAANNVFNTPNYTGLGTVVNASDFGRVTSVGTMRTLTLSMRLNF